jgi:3-methyladenine DNA glycosylase Tag
MPSREWMSFNPKTDDDYFERMTRALFQAGLNWKMIEAKWPNFQNAFSQFSIKKVAKFNEKDVKRLMNDKGVIRNERKIVSTIYNAQQSLRLTSEFGSFGGYIKSFGKDHEALQNDLQTRFHHLGESSSRTFLCMSGVKLAMTPEEKEWLARNS